MPYEITIKICDRGSINVQAFGDERLLAQHGCNVVLQLAGMVDNVELIHLEDANSDCKKPRTNCH